MTLVNNDSPERRRRILQYANNIMHDEVAKGEIIVVAKHSRQDPRKFTIIADSEYDKALEGIDLIFNDAEDFKRIFPDQASPPPVFLSPGLERDTKTGIAVPAHKDPYRILAVYSDPKPDNPDLYGVDNVLDDDSGDTYWSVKKNPAYLFIDLGEDVDIGTVWIRWHQGQLRQFRFTIAVATNEQIASKEKTFTVIPHLDEKYSSGTTDQLEPYNLATDHEMLTRARVIMVKIYGNTLNDDFASISHVKVTRATSLKPRETDKIIERTTDNTGHHQKQKGKFHLSDNAPDIKTPPNIRTPPSPDKNI